MSVTRHLRRSAPLGAVACALLATSAAAADPLAQERYYSSHGTEISPPASQVQEQYYSSYGEPSAPAAPSSDDGPWLPIVLSVGGAVIAVAVSTTQARRVRIRRRRTAGIPA